MPRAVRGDPDDVVLGPDGAVASRAGCDVERRGPAYRGDGRQQEVGLPCGRGVQPAADGGLLDVAVGLDLRERLPVAAA